MITKFYAQNFYSINDRVEVNLESTTGKSIKHDELYFHLGGTNVTKICFLGGKNASGKSNILKALSFLQYLITKKIDSSVLNFIPYLANKEHPSTIGAEFLVDSASHEKYAYEITFDRQGIVSESLSEVSHKNINIFTRTLAGNKYIFQPSTEKLALISQIPQNQLEGILGRNRTISAITLLKIYEVKDGVLSRISNFWDDVLSNVSNFSLKESALPLSIGANLELEKIYEDEKMRKFAAELLKNYDVGITGIDKRSQAGPNRNETIYLLKHVLEEKMNFGYSVGVESTGTQRVILLVRIIAAALATGGVAIIDELDAFLHPDIYNDILNLFTSETVNFTGAQLIFSSQNYEVMGRLDKQQIFLSDKNDRGSTELWRLDSLKGVRPDDNYYAKYLTGAYGGIPKTLSHRGRLLDILKEMNARNTDNGKAR